MVLQALFLFFPAFFDGFRHYFISDRFSFQIKIRRMESLTLVSGILPLRMASAIADFAAEKLGGQIRSFPASTASTAASSVPQKSRIAFISRSSVITTPENPISSLRIRWTAGERDAGFSASMQATILWLTITESAPAAIPDKNGRNKKDSSCKSYEK